MAKRIPLPRTSRVLPSRAIERWLGITALLAALILVAAALLVREVNNRSIEAGKRVAHSSQVVAELDQLRIALEMAEAGQRGFVLIGKPSYLEPYQQAHFDANLHLAALRPLTYDRPDQTADLRNLEPLVAARFEYLSRSINIRNDSGLDAARHQLEADPGKKTIEPIEILVDKMQRREAERLADELGKQESTALYAQAVMVVTLTALAILSLIFWLVLKREFAVRQRLEKVLVESATSDELTGAINRSEFERLLSEEWAFRERYGTPLSLLLIDLFSIEQVSATWGLRAADSIMRDAVRRLRSRIRSTERVARYSGQQFALLVPQQRAAAEQLAQQLIEVISVAGYTVRGGGDITEEGIQMEVCVGLADASDVEDRTELVEAANAALHVARAKGPNEAQTYRVTMRPPMRRARA